MTPGEVAAAGYTGYLTEKALTGMYAKSVGGAVIVVERMDDPTPLSSATTTWRHSNSYIQIATGETRAHSTSRLPRTCST